MLGKEEIGEVREAFDCDCGSIEHMMVASYFDYRDDWPPEFYVHLQIRPNGSVLKRIWYALKYVCGKSSDSAYWADTLLNTNNATRLRDMLNDFLEAHKNNRKQ